MRLVRRQEVHDKGRVLLGQYELGHCREQELGHMELEQLGHRGWEQLQQKV